MYGNNMRKQNISEQMCVMLIVADDINAFVA